MKANATATILGLGMLVGTANAATVCWNVKDDGVSENLATIEASVTPAGRRTGNSIVIGEMVYTQFPTVRASVSGSMHTSGNKLILLVNIAADGSAVGQGRLTSTANATLNKSSLSGSYWAHTHRDYGSSTTYFFPETGTMTQVPCN